MTPTEKQINRQTDKQRFVVVVAGGSGSRMGADVPKQFLPLGGRPILQRTLEQFLAYDANGPAHRLQIRLVLPEAQFGAWAALCEQHRFFPETLRIVAGGATRFQSVLRGLATIDAPDDALVAVHDGVRPFVSPVLIGRGFAEAARSGSAVACVPAKDSVRVLHPDGQSAALDRAAVRLVQTPQTFRLGWMRDAFSRGEQPHFTDCASVLEAAGYAISLIDGYYDNLKITTPEDLRWAEGHFGER